MANQMIYKLPRFMIAAPKSGQGKTMLTCALLSLLAEERMDVKAFKCGPDYIDPMFHRRVLSIPSYNLDRFFVDDNTLRYLLGRHGNGGRSIAVLEGVMGYYDGLGGISDAASSYDVARITKTPAVLVMDASGTSLSILASLKGFLKFRKNSWIGGVIFNRLSPSLYPGLKAAAERELGIPVLGYLPVFPDISWESRHLGLIKPEEIPEFKKQIAFLADRVRRTVDLSGLLALAHGAGELSVRPFAIPFVPERNGRRPKIAVAMDEAFCFYYQDNLELLERMGAELLYFSPLRDQAVPKEAGGLYLGGGYPELYGKELAENRSMRESVRLALESGMPCIAECGGYLYLKEWMEDAEGERRPMAGFLPGGSANAGKLCRFGYLKLSGRQESMLVGGKTSVPAHEFHYWDCEENGTDYDAFKETSGKKWECAYGSPSFYAGFPHLHFYSRFPYSFVKQAAYWEEKKYERDRKKSK